VDWKCGAASAVEHKECRYEDESDAGELAACAEILCKGAKYARLPEARGSGNLINKMCWLAYITKPKERNDQLCRETHDDWK
jgi:hypothetical protein